MEYLRCFIQLIKSITLDNIGRVGNFFSFGFFDFDESEFGG
jgi:hypothetical protein